MPLYEYVCAHCGKRFGKLRPIREMDAPARCPSCGSEQSSRVLSVVSDMKNARCGPVG